MTEQQARIIRRDLVGVVFAHQEYGLNPVMLAAGEAVPDGYEVDADLLVAPGAALGLVEATEAPAAPAAVTSTAPDRGPQAGTVRTSTRRAKVGDKQ